MDIDFENAPIRADGGMLDPLVFKLLKPFYLSFDTNAVTATDQREENTGNIWRSWGMIAIRGVSIPSFQGGFTATTDYTIEKIYSGSKQKATSSDTYAPSKDSNVIIMNTQSNANGSSSNVKMGPEMQNSFFFFFPILQFLPEFLYYERRVNFDALHSTSSGQKTYGGYSTVYIRYPRPTRGLYNGEIYITGGWCRNGVIADYYDSDLYSNKTPKNYIKSVSTLIEDQAPGACIDRFASKYHFNMSPVAARECLLSWYDIGQGVSPEEFITHYPNLSAILPDPYTAFKVRHSLLTFNN